MTNFIFRVYDYLQSEMNNTIKNWVGGKQT